MSATEAKTIRTNLKAKGITARQVSVRASTYSMGSSVSVTIKDPTVSFDLVKRIALAEQHIDRCEITHEILNGGNTYIHVDYSRDAEEALAAPFLEAVAAAFEKSDLTDNILYRVEGSTVSLRRDGRQDVRLWSDSEDIVSRNVWADGEDFHPVALVVARMTAEAAAA